MLPRHAGVQGVAALGSILLALGGGPAAAQDTPLITGVHHVHMNVVDPDLSIAFYTGAIELIETTEAPARASRRRLLLTHNAFYKHDSLAAAEAAVVELGREAGGLNAFALTCRAGDARVIAGGTPWRKRIS